MPQSVKSAELLGRWPFGAIPLGGRLCENLYFFGQVVCHHSAEGIYLITGQFSGCNDIEATVTFCIAEDGFLGTASVMELNDGLG